MDKLFKARLKGKNEVPPVETHASGIAKFASNKHDTKIKFVLKIEDIENFVQAHIHFGNREQNGPVVAFLFGADLETLPNQNGISTQKGVVTGILKDEDIVKNDVGIHSIADLLDCMKKELTYVNVHTEQNLSGEIRGQIVPLQEGR
ncbi:MULTISPECIES: CHRD domain-containing protein [Pontibacillus]|uniref:CHRD domain-containing protein n=1 Tax=Pontibacillus chungwhensis TaxID=265426 RepID=A0ABY8V1R0_9BACI|nr:MULTISPECIES: CHRD domain-containing protein [Pontibacillus]MCD5325415.1 CHRD domain-containing protein [Pontibacillus sp. HN14]WIF98530.1 CHRD domain-containing protein [Pontibacillus chungwhensis]